MSRDYDRNDRILENIKNIAMTIGLLAAIAWCIYWLGFNPNSQKIQAAKDWQRTPALVSQVSEVQGDSAYNAFRMATLQFSDYYGAQRTVEVPMRYETSIGDTKSVLVGKNGGVYVGDRLGSYENNPLDVSDKDHWLMTVFVIPPLIVGLLAWGASWLLLFAIVALFFWAVRLLTTPILFRLIGRTVRRTYLRCRDEIKLRIDFFRRRKRIRPSPAYKLVRRFQAELARMDSTEKVIEARRKANELMTRVLERDNQRVEVIDGVITEIRGDIDLDLKARELAHEELAEKS